MKVKAGDKVRCTHSASCGYKKGNTYEVKSSPDGLTLTSDDGFEDLICMVISTFEKI